MVAAIFFLASLVHVPLGLSNAHLTLNGLVGLVLGWGAIPAIFVALSLQALLFQFGGLTTLGVNTLIMAAPAVLCALAFRPLLASSRPRLVSLGAFFTGFCALGLSGFIMAGLPGSFGRSLSAAGLAGTTRPSAAHADGRTNKRGRCELSP